MKHQIHQRRAKFPKFDMFGYIHALAAAKYSLSQAQRHTEDLLAKQRGVRPIRHRSVHPKDGRLAIAYLLSMQLWYSSASVGEKI
jgi:hypothetical protein